MTRIAIYRIQMTTDGGENWNTLPGRFEDMDTCVAEIEALKALKPDAKFSGYYDHEATMYATAERRGLQVVTDGWCLAYAPSIN